MIACAIRFFLLSSLLLTWHSFCHSQAASVALKSDSTGWVLLRNGEEHFVNKDANSFWPSENQGPIPLIVEHDQVASDSAYERGMTVTLGLYLRPERMGMTTTM